MGSTFRGRALGVALGLTLDRLAGEPPTAWHPVAWFGTAMSQVERRLYADARLPGAAYALVGVGVGAGSGWLLGRVGRRLPGRETDGAAGVAVLAAAVGVACAGRMLRETSARIEDRLRADDLDVARELLPWLVGRDPSTLDASGVAAAVVESLAENTVDAVVAPVFWGLLAGAPGVLAHRAVNTMDAMVGHRSARYGRFGTAAARLDDVMAWVPARVFAALVAVLAALPTGAQRSAERFAQPRSAERLSPRPPARGSALPQLHQVLSVVRRDAPAHPSPNSGVAESAVAAALGVELGGPLRYGDRVENRPHLGDGPRPDHVTIGAARQLVDRVEITAVVICLLLAAAASDRTRGTRTSTPARRSPR
ncbi:CobD/CbiB family cobalamin biosynthesis protein [Ornithinimicrobium sufpigmenti]|uniref:CobD/CbiB family cobalamin biosynthesis protein n=1 Tax=Ornithinimicrobium sufpigmenti TaxID=2508882 RepID=UPI0015E175A5|nr:MULTISPECIES: CobD/CbiB family cobalamin biosynthesis protein [unclassified Ornithinimicrobium]